MEQQDPSGDENAPLSRQRLVDLVVFESSARVLRRLGVTADWRALHWTDDAACTDHDEATPQLCARCPVAGPCLAAAMTSDDRTEWRGGLYLSDRDGLWTGMERTYRDVCDLELMRLDITCLPRRDVMPRPNGHPQNGHRS